MFIIVVSQSDNSLPPLLLSCLMFFLKDEAQAFLETNPHYINYGKEPKAFIQELSLFQKKLY